MNEEEIKQITFPDIKNKILDAASSKEPLILDKEDVQTLARIVAEHALFEDRLKAARDVFFTDGRHDKRASDAVKELGFSEGRRKSRINHEAVFWEYLDLTLGGIDWSNFQLIPAVSKTEAVKIIQKKYDLQSYDAAYKFIQRIIKQKGQSGQGLLPANWSDL